MTGVGRLLADLNECRLRYVVVGGIAVIRHGVVRATTDVDVVIAADGATAAVVGSLVGKWKATRPDGSAEGRRVPSPGWPLHLRTAHGLIDLMAEMAPPLDLEDQRRLQTAHGTLPDLPPA